MEFCFKFLIFALIFSISGKRIIADQVCFRHLGCFGDQFPVSRFRKILPESPAFIDTHFELFTRNNRLHPDKFTENSPSSILINSNMISGRKTIFIVHGYFSSAQEKWVKEMKEALLDYYNYNLVVVDWKRGASRAYYKQSVANTRVVAAQIALLIRKLKVTKQIRPSDIHLIGHSLGAHVCGFVGELIDGISRISGLDPAGVGFEPATSRYRLDADDARFVDVIHTDGGRWHLGTLQPWGDADFYPNGGTNQPHCDGASSCSHSFATKLFTESITNKQVATSCNSYRNFKHQRCNRCLRGCNYMGFHARKPRTRKKYYIDIQAGKVEAGSITAQSKSSFPSFHLIGRA